MKVQKSVKMQNSPLSLERKYQMFFSGNQEDELADLILPGCEGMELQVKGNRLILSGETKTVVKNEREPIEKDTILKPGDTIQVGDLCLTFFKESKSAVITGNIKEQNVFPYTGIREENRKIDFGYYYKRGELKKMKLMQSSEEVNGE